MKQASVTKLKPVQNELHSEITLITPEMATRWLEKNTINRPISDQTVGRYAAAMCRGEWTLTHQGVAMDRHGRVQDGQHRLWAIIKSDTPVRMMVTTGLSDASIRNIDIQRTRSPGDALGIMAKMGQIDLSAIGDARPVAQIAAMIHILIASANQKGNIKPSHDELVQIITKFKDGIAATCVHLPSKTGIGVAPVRGAISFAHKTDPAKVEEFAKQMYSGADLAGDSPVLSLRNYILQGPGKGTRGRRTLAIKTLSAIGYFISGSKAKRAAYGSEDALAFFGLAHGVKMARNKRGSARAVRFLAAKKK